MSETLHNMDNQGGVNLENKVLQIKDHRSDLKRASDQDLAKLFSCYDCEIKLSRMPDTQIHNINKILAGNSDKQNRSRKYTNLDRAKKEDNGKKKIKRQSEATSNKQDLGNLERQVEQTTLDEQISNENSEDSDTDDAESLPESASGLEYDDQNKIKRQSKAPCDEDLADLKSQFKPNSDEKIASSNCEELSHNLADHSLSLKLPEDEFHINAHTGQKQTDNFKYNQGECFSEHTLLSPGTSSKISDGFQQPKISKTGEDLSDNISLKVKKSGFNCEECGKVFKFSGNLNRHIKSHKVLRGETSLSKCTECKMSYTRFDSLQQHMVRVHSYKKYSLNDHHRLGAENVFIDLEKNASVELEKQYRCKECPRAFSRADKLLIHTIKAHTGNDTEELRIYKEGRTYCKHCPRTFSSADSLMLHTCKVHSQNGSGPPILYEEVRCYCNQCPQSFSRADTLRRHIVRVHGDEENADVQRKIKRQSQETSEDDLGDPENQFKPVSTDLEKPCKCKECPRSFAREDTLLVHVVKAHTQNNTEEFTIYKEGRCYCKLCPKTFTSADTLILHTIKVHGCEENAAKGSAVMEENDVENNINSKNATCSNEDLGDPKTLVHSNENSNDLLHYTDILQFDNRIKEHGRSKDRTIQNSIIADDSKLNLCYLCGKGFPLHSSYKAHMAKEYSGNINKGFVCIICGKSYKSFDCLRKHRRSSHDWYNCYYCCAECGERFIEKSDLIEHLQQHLSGKSDEGSSQSVKHEGNSTQSAESHQDAHQQLTVGDKMMKGNCGSSSQQTNADSNSMSHTCTKCKKSFASDPDLQIHLKIYEHSILTDNFKKETSVEDVQKTSHENGEKVSNICGYYCEDCPKNIILHLYCQDCPNIFCYNKTLKQHLARFHPERVSKVKFKNRKIQCTICGVFIPKSNLKAHMAAKHSAQRDYKCNQCGQDFHSRWLLKDHMRIRHSNIKPYMCSKCGKGFTRLLSLNKHTKYLHGAHSSFSCEECGKRFNRPESLRKHIQRIHSGQNPDDRSSTETRVRPLNTRNLPQHICSECGKGFGKPFYLKTHMTTIHNICSECGAVFGQPSDLQEHMVAMHPHFRKVKCDQCGQRFTRISSLNTHTRHVHGVQNCYSCGECGKCYSRAGDLKRHMKELHDGLTSFSCAMCAQRFIVLLDLHTHIAQYHQPQMADMALNRTHTGKCGECGQSFEKHSDLKNHMAAIHPCVPFHICIKCGETFSQVENLNIHLKHVHGEQKSYSCPECAKSFGYTNNLRQHMKKVHHGLNSFSCAKCGHVFTVIRDLEKHALTCHQERTGAHTGDSLWHVPLEPNIAESEQTFINTHDQLDTTDFEIMKESGQLTRINNGFNEMYHTCSRCKKYFAYVHDLHLHVKTCLIYNKTGNSAPAVSEERTLFENNEGIHFQNILHSNDITDTLQNEIRNREYYEKGVNYSLPSMRTFNCIECEQRFHDAEDLEVHMTNHLVEVSNLLPTKLKPTTEVHNWLRSSEKLIEAKDLQVPNDRYRSGGLQNKMELDDNISEDDYVEEESNLSQSADSSNNTESIEELNGNNNLTIGKPSSFDSDSEIAEACDLSTNKSNDGQDQDVQLYTCFECDEQFSQLQELQDHQVIHRVNMDDESVETITYDEKLTDKSIVESLIIKFFSCLECGEKFTKSEDLQIHKKSHANETLFADSAHIKHGSDVTAIALDEKPITCAQCKKSFTEKGAFNKHIETHITANSRYLCKECGKCYKNKAHLHRHMVIHTGSKPHCCDKCGERFYRKELLQYHIKIYHSDTKPPRPLPKECPMCGKKVRDLDIHMNGHKRFLCTQCGKSLADKSTYERHMEAHAGIKSFPCSVCDKWFASTTTLKAHMSKHTGEKPFQCEICGKGFALRNRLQAHIQTHGERKPETRPAKHVCNQCGKGFLWHSKLKHHMRSHTGLKPHVCTVCGRGYAHAYNLMCHMQSHTNPVKHTCPTCGQICASASILLIHIKGHSGIRPHTCTQCGKSFLRRASLVIHMKRHFGIKPHECTKCNRSFVLNSDLVDHMKRHSGEKPHSCPECHKRFVTKSDVRKHVLIHSGVKPHACLECHSRFLMKSDLRKHMRTHLNIRAFSCSQCEKSFVCERYLQSHMQIHSGEVFSCPVCNRTFVLKRSLKKHMLKNH